MTTPPGGTKVEIGPWVSAGFRMFTAHWQTWVKMGAITFLPMVIPMVLLLVGYFGLIVSIVPDVSYDEYGYAHATGPEGPPIWALAVLGSSFLLLFAAGLVSMYFSIGMWKAAFKQARGGAPEMSDLRGNGHLFGKVFVASLVVGLLQSIGFMLCYIPGFIVMAWYLYVIPLTIDRELSLGDAMATSKGATSPQLLMFVLWAFVVGVLASLGSYICYVGIIATMPLYFTMTAVSYRACFEGVSPTPAQPTAWPPPAGPMSGAPPPAGTPPGAPPPAGPPQASY